MSFPLPPATRSVGSPNPPGDMNQVVTALSALQYKTAFPVFPATGNTLVDTPNVLAAIAQLTATSGYGTLQFCDGIYQVDGNALVVRNCSNFLIKGSGATIIQQAPNRTGLPNNATGNLMTLADCTNFQVFDLTFDGARDTVSPMTPLTAIPASAQPSVTVAAGLGARYLPGQRLALFGGLGSADQNLSDGWAGGQAGGMVISSITPGGGTGGGDLITFGTNIAATYTVASSTPFSDSFGPYAYAGVYLTSYEAALNNPVAGRNLSAEDQQNGLHLLNCQQFTVSRVISRNLWESPIKMGTGGKDASVLTDGCSQGSIVECTGYHAYDQGVSVWMSQQITVQGCAMNSVGWGGVVLSQSDNCTVSGNVITNSTYRVPNDPATGSGICLEGGQGNTIVANTIIAPYGDGIRLFIGPVVFTAGTPTLTTYLTGQTAAGTSVAVSNTSGFIAGGLYALADGARSENLTVATVVDGTHLTFTTVIQFSHPNGTYLVQRIATDNIIAGNGIYAPVTGSGILQRGAARNILKGNIIREWSLGSGGAGSGITCAYSNQQLPAGIYLGGDGSHIEGNDIAGGFSAGVVCDSTAEFQIIGNRITGLQSNQPGVSLKGVTDSVVSGNKISDMQTSQGIVLQNGTLAATVAARVTVTGNEIRRTSNEGILALFGDSLTISGNVVNSCGGNAGIDMRGVTNSVIANNVCNSNKNSGILLELNSATGCTSNRVIGNTCRDDGSGVMVSNGNAWTQQNGILESGGATNGNLFVGNEVDGNAIGQLTTVGGASVSHYNTISGTISA